MSEASADPSYYLWGWEGQKNLESLRNELPEPSFEPGRGSKKEARSLRTLIIRRKKN